MKKVLMFLIVFSFLTCSFFVLASDKVEINTASLEQLDEIIGIGPAIGQRIIDGRPFSSVDDLLRVKGIGEKTLQKIKDQGLAYVGEKSETNSNYQNSNIQNATTPTIISEPIPPPAPAPAPTIIYPSGIIFSEILPSPEGADEENEWIELYNTNNFEVDLSGWKIKDTTGTTTTFIIPKYLPAGRQAKISANGFLIFKRPDTKITLNNTTDGLAFFWPNEKIIDSMAYEKAPSNQSYNRIGTNWRWSASLTPNAKNIIIENNIKQRAENLSKIEKSDNNKEIDRGLATISQSTNNQESIKNINPWFLFLIALSVTIISAIIVLFIKFKLKKHVGT